MTLKARSMNPFPGLRPFRSDEDYLFFGREEQTLELLQRLASNRFVAVVGTSGSGKSSLVRCGLLSELQGGKMLKAGAAWEIAVTHPGGNPLALLTEALLDADLYDRQQEHIRENLLATLSRSHFGLIEAVKQAGLDEGTNFLLVVDQFEEIFRFHEAGQTQQEVANEFVSLLLEAVAQTETPIYVVLTMRSDFIGECGQFEGLAEMVNRGEFLIPRLTRDQYKRVIEGPIKVAGGQIAPRLLQRLLNDLGQQADQLPCLQHALMRTWTVWSELGDSEALDLDDYQRVGRMSEALSLHADEIYASLADDRQRDLCRGIFQALTVQESENRGIRRPQRLGNLCQILDVPTDELRPIIDAYRHHGVTFLTPSPEVELTDRTIVDISHESLMRVWTRLRHWVEEEAQAAGIYRRLSESAALYAQKKAGLYRDPELGIALAWREETRPNQAWAERYHAGFAGTMEFLEASRQASLAEEQAREAARQRELEQAQQLAEARQQRLEQQQRAARRLRSMLAGLAAVAVIAGVACIFALVANNKANRLAERAQRSAETATKAQKDTELALIDVASKKAEVEGERNRAETNLKKAVAAEQAALAAEQRSREFRYATDIQLAATLLADDRANAGQVLARLANHDPAANEELQGKDDLRGFEWHYLKRLLDSRAAVFTGVEKPVLGTALTPDGELAILDEDAQLHRRDATTRLETRPVLDLKQGRNVGAKTLASDGRRVALAVGAEVHVVDAANGEDILRLPNAPTSRGMIFSPDGRLLVTLDHQVIWWDATDGSPLASAESKLSNAGPLSISQDGLTLAVGGQGNGIGFSIFRMNPETREVSILQDKLSANFGGTRAFVISPDGKSLAISQMFDGQLRLYDTTSGQPVSRNGTEHSASVSAIVFSPSGDTMVTASLDGVIKVWKDLRSLQAAESALLGHTKEITRLVFADGGKTLISSSLDKTTRIWDLTRKTASLHQQVAGTASMRGQFSPDGLLVATTESASGVRIKDASTGKTVLVIGERTDGLSPDSIAFAPDNRLLAVGFGGGKDTSFVELWDLDLGQRLAVMPGTTDLPNFVTNESTGIVSGLAFSPDGKHLVASFGSLFQLAAGKTGNSPLAVYDVASRRLARWLEGHKSYCTSVKFSADGSRLASGSYDGTAILWDTKNWASLHVLDNPDPSTDVGMQRVFDVAFSPAGDLLAMASYEGNVVLWDVATGKYLRSLSGHANGVSCVGFAPDGRTLASGSFDYTIRLWSVATWQEVVRLAPSEVHFVPRALAFSPDGTRLLGTGDSALLWSTQAEDGRQAEQTAARLSLLLKSPADFQNRIRMLSENRRLHEALQLLRQQDPDDARIPMALAAAEANWHASRQDWPRAVEAHDRLRQLSPAGPEGWLRTPGLMRLATALLHQGRAAEAAGLLAGGAKRRAADGLEPATEGTGIGIVYSTTDGTVRINDLLVGYPGARGGIRVGDVVLKANDVELTAESLPKLREILSGKAGSTIRLTVKHAGNAQPEVIDLTQAEYVRDPATGELLYALRTALDERLAKEPRNAGLLELRAELAGQWQGHEAQAADYSAAIEALSESPDASAEKDLARLFRRRADAYGRLKRWKSAIEDYAKVVTEATTDEELLTSQALAQAGAQLESMWLVKTSEGEEVAWRFQTSAPPTDWMQPEFDDSQWPQGPGGFGAIGTPGAVVRTPWTTSDIWLRRSFQWESDPTLKSLALRLHHDDHVEVYLNGKQIANSQSLTLSYRWQPLGEEAIAALRPGTNTLAVHCRQYTGGQYVDVGICDAAMSKWWANSIAQDPWKGLALAYAIADDQPAIDQLVARRTQSAGPIGDVFIQGEQKDWSRAVAIYSQGITEEKADTELLSRRARAYEELKDWNAAAADWARAAAGNRDGAKLIAEFGQRLVKADQRELAAPQLQQARLLLEAALQEDPENLLAVQALAQVLFDSSSPPWTTLKPAAVKSQGGSTLTVLEDDSILASGVDPDKDVYEVEAEAAAEGITAIRLEVLTHDSFPRQGHGRNPNVILTEFEAAVAAPGDSSSWEAISFVRAWADHSQPGSRIENAIDGQAATGWTTEGHNLQEDRTAFFVADSPFGFDAGTRLRIRLRQESPQWAKHLLGRFRLAVTSRREPVPAAITDLRLRLALAYAQADEPGRAAQWAATAFEKAKTHESKVAIGKHLQPFADALTSLIKLRPADAQLQLALARHHAERGQLALRRKRPAEALADLEQARTLFTRMLEAPRTQWEVLQPTSLNSEGGATLTRQEDGSILAGGTNPDRDVYTFVAKTGLPRIAAIRLEALPDPSLPQNGPGRSANANFHLGEFRVFSQGSQATLTDMIVAHDELQGFRSAIDGRIDARMGWSNQPKAGEKNAALFATAIDTSADGELKFEMYFSRGSYTQHNLGCFRLSVTGDAAAFSEDELHDNRIPGELTDLEVAIGRAHAASGQVTLAAAALAKALNMAKSREDRTKILDQCSSLEETLAELVKIRPGDVELQLALARSFAQRGRASLSQDKEEALPTLDQARQVFTRLLAEHPPVQWTVLEPAEMKSAGGAGLQLQSDGSILASGPHPSPDVYTLTFSKLPQRISGLRLEVLPDESLPSRGPGRAFNGNLVLTEIQAKVQPAGSGPEQILPLQSAIATHEQNFSGLYPIAAAIDSDLSNSKGWALLPKLGQAHHAVFELKGAVEAAAGSTLTISLVQNFNSHQIGRFRISATADANAIQATQLHRDLADSGLADLESALASADAQQGRSDDAAAGFGRAVDLATDLAAAAKVVQEASAHAGVLEKLAQQRTADARFHNAVARHYALLEDAERCQDAAAKSRELYEQNLQAEPGNSQLATELADLLLEVSPRQWTALKPVQMKSAGGATLTVQPDGSVLASGTNPDRDIYTITAVGNLEQVAAIRLEAMADPSLPHGGPGRFPDNGNITLSEIRVSVRGSAVPLTNVAVTYSQHDGYLKTIDGQIDTSHWSIYPRSGQTHSLLVATQIDGAMGQELTFELDCSRSDYTRHSLGRFRLSVSAEPQAALSERSRVEALQIASPWPRLGAAYMYVGDKTKSAAAFAQALALAADDAAKTEVARLIAPFEDAFAGLAEQAPQSTFLRLGQAKYLGPKRMAENKFHDAVVVLSGALQIAPDDLELLLWRGDANARLGQWSAAIADYDQVIQRQTDPGKRREVQRARAEAQLRRGRSAEGAEVYSQEMILFPTWDSMRDGFSAQLLAGNRDVAKGAALRLYAQVATADRDAYWSQWLVRSSIAVPGLVTAQNRERLLSAAAKSGGDWTAPMTGAIHYRLGNLKEAEPLLGTAAGRPEFLCLAALLAQDRGETDKARQYLRQADNWFRQQRARDPSSDVPVGQDWREWGVRMALWREAVRKLASPRIAELDALLAREPQNAAALLERAQLLAAAGLPEEALADLTKAGEPSANSAEYLGLRGRIFAALNRPAEGLADLNRAVEASSADPLVYAARGAIRLKQQDVPGARGDLEKSLALAPSEQAAGALAELLLAEAEKTISWTVAKPAEMKSAAGATLTLQEDGSVFVDGKRPVKDVYTLEFADVSQPLQALRLEAMRDDRLPNGGPGTYPGGEFVLSDLAAYRPDEAGSSGPAQVPLRSATATFEERRARDSLTTGEFGWSIAGATGRTQTAYFAVEPGESAPASSRLRLVLEFSHEPSGGYSATLGRFRLSVSDDPQAFRQERDRLAALRMSSGWARLAAAYRLAGNQAEFERTIAEHPEAQLAIAEAYFQVESFQQALEYLDQAITADSKDADLLARRAEVHGQLRQWDQADADWQRALELRPQDAGLKDRWLAALAAGEQWDEIAREYGRQIDALPEGRASWAPRGQLIRTLIRRNDPVFERLMAQRPDDAMLRVHLARNFVVRSDWQDAIQQYAKSIDIVPPEEEGYEYAAALLLAGKREEFDRFLKQFVERAGTTDQSYVAYALARVAAVSPTPIAPPEKLKASSDLALRDERLAWYLHAAGLAQLRAGNSDEALKLLEESAATPWHPELNQLGLALYYAQHKDLDKARAYLAQAEQWFANTKPVEGYYPVQDTDWLEAHLLLREIKSLLEQ